MGSRGAALVSEPAHDRQPAMSSIRETFSEPFGRLASLITSILSAG